MCSYARVLRNDVIGFLKTFKPNVARGFVFNLGQRLAGMSVLIGIWVIINRRAFSEVLEIRETVFHRGEYWS